MIDDEVLAAVAAGGVLATVVAVEGSAYRREGARLAMPAGAPGWPLGAISGGCLEAEVAEVARRVAATGRPELARFDLTGDDEPAWGWGLGCQGALEVLVEPARSASPLLAAAAAARHGGTPVAVVTVVDGGPLAARLVVHGDGRTEAGTGDHELDGPARRAGLEALGTGHPATVHLRPGPGRPVRAFVEVLEPPPHLVVCGAGPGAAPLVALASGLGWRVDVADDRPARLVAGLLPGAARLVAAPPTEVADAVGAGARTAAVIMSHDLGRDAGYLRSLVVRPLAYLGVLGPAARLESLLARFAADGVDLDPATRRRLHGPAGLDIGADGPAEIAVAIMAELLAARRGASATSLRDRPGPIHRRVSRSAG